MLGGADNPNGELLSYIIGADTVAGWKETQVSDMDFDTIMKKAYEEYFEGLAEGEETLSFSEFKQALSSSAKSNG